MSSIARWVSVLSCMVACACGSAQELEPGEDGECTPPTELRAFDGYRFIAHAAGAPDGLTQAEYYTNSREAFETSYANGFRVFEFDMVSLADGTAVVAHNGTEEIYDLPGNFGQLSRTDVEGARWFGRYEILFAEDLVEIMVDHPDIWVVLDTKWRHTQIVEVLLRLSPDDSVRNRFVPNLASADHAAELLELHPFPEMMIATYRWPGTDAEIVQRRDAFGAKNVSMWWYDRWRETTQQAMEAEGIAVWVHTPRQPALIRAYRRRNVGVFTDGYIDECEGEAR